jgi:hypothetical protein
MNDIEIPEVSKEILEVKLNNSISNAHFEEDN